MLMLLAPATPPASFTINLVHWVIAVGSTLTATTDGVIKFTLFMRNEFDIENEFEAVIVWPVPPPPPPPPVEEIVMVLPDGISVIFDP